MSLYIFDIRIYHLTCLCNNKLFLKHCTLIRRLGLYDGPCPKLLIILLLNGRGTTATIREKGRDLTQSYDKSPYTNRNVKRAKWQHKQRFDYTAVANRLRTVSWSNYGHPTGVVNLVYGPNLPTPRNSCVIKRTHVYNFVKKNLLK